MHLPVPLREARALPRHARQGGRGRQAPQVLAGRAGRQGLEAAQSLLQPLHGRLHGAQAPRAEAAQDGGERGRRDLWPLLHESGQVPDHEHLRGPGQVRASRGQELRDELRVPDQRLGGLPGLRGCPVEVLTDLPLPEEKVYPGGYAPPPHPPDPSHPL